MDDYTNQLEAYRKAGRSFAWEEFSRLGRNVVHHLRRARRTGLLDEYGDHRSLWDEFRCYKELNVIEEIEQTWRPEIEHFIRNILAKIPTHQAILLSTFAMEEHDQQ